MKKPNSYDTTQAPGEFNPIKPGGYACKIMEVVEMKSKSQLDMLKISIDVTDGEFKEYYAKMYRNDTRTEKKWSGVIYLVVDETTEYGVKNLKGFTTSVEKSNEGFQIVWGDKFAATLKGKKIGCIFRKEQYHNSHQELKWITKPFQFRSVEGALSAEIPEDKYIDDAHYDAAMDENQGNTNGSIGDFQPAGIDEELPFM